MEDNSVDLILTDPPYNINFKPQRGTFDGIENDNKSWEEFNKFMQPIMNECFRVLKNGSVAYFFTGFSSSSAFYQYAIKAGFNVKCQIVWVKNNFGTGYHFRPQHEDIWCCFKGRPHVPEKAISSVIFEKKVNGVDLLHSCEKPVNLLKILLKQYTKMNSLIFDPFMGVGSTAIAAKETNNNFIGFEIDEEYYKSSLKRIGEQTHSFW